MVIRYKLSAFCLDDGRLLAWEDDLSSMRSFWDTPVDVRALVTENLAGRPVGTDEVQLGRGIFRRWWQWGTRDGQTCLLVRLTLLSEGEAKRAEQEPAMLQFMG